MSGRGPSVGSLARPASVADGGQRNHRWAALVVVCASALIINLDNTILNVALPTLVRDLRATSSELQWIVDSYAMVFAGLLFVGGSLADRFGRKRLFLIGLTVFAVGSIGAAFSGSVHLLIACRAVMGAGAALTIPASLSIINDIFRDPAERARAIGAWAATIGLGIAAGPIAGGLLLSKFWWGSIFLVNVPIAIAGFVGALVLVPDSKNPAAERPDPGGAVLSMAGLGLLLWTIIEGPAEDWTSGLVVGAGLASVLVLGTFVAWEAHNPHPMLNLRFFADRRFSMALAAECLGAFGLLGALFVQTQFLQFDLGYSPLQAGLRILPVAALIAVSAPLSPVMARIVGTKFTVAAALTAIAGGLWQFGRLLAGHDLHRGRARPAAHRPGRRAPLADGDELGRGVGPPGRLRDRLGSQRRRASSRRRPGSRRGRERDVDPLPGPYDGGTGWPPHALSCHPYHPRLARRCARGGAQCRRQHWDHARPRGAHRLHERQRGGVGCRRRRRSCWRRDRARPFTGATQEPPIESG